MFSFKANDPKSKRQLRGPPQGSPVPSGTKEHILIVDDEKWIVHIGQEMLRKLGYQVTGCANGMEALEAVRQQPERFDLVITDFIMPGMNGVELAQELSRLHPGLPVILYTAIDQAISREIAKKAGIVDYLIKPLRFAELHQAIRRVLDARLPAAKASNIR
ncbi:MAG: response regulator [Syntrophales bacterium]|nr:response regulator [Syntrophales bacterium]MDD5640558.1 response regulator [Syntrophales bacterium]